MGIKDIKKQKQYKPKIKPKTMGTGPGSDLNGITLPALVVTIIIMLILAGVTLNLTLGNRSFFKSTKELQDTQTIAEYKERVEIARGGTAVNNLGIVTLDTLTKQIYEDKVVPEGSIRKIDEEQAQMTTPEGYVFIITADKIEYKGDAEAIPTPPDLTEANVEFTLEPNKWTNENVKISIQQKAGDKFTIEYSTNAKEWKEYTKEIETNQNITIYARIKNPLGVVGNYASRKITNIDKLDPIKITPKISATTNTITINAEEAEDAKETSKYGSSGIKQIWYSKDEGTTWQTNEKAKEKTYTYKQLEQNKAYKIQVKIIDNAGNQTITDTQEITTGQVDIAKGNITINAPTWDASTHTASVAITKESTASNAFSIQYQIVKPEENLTEAKWKNGTNITGLSLNDTVYARLWDGTNGGTYTSLKITESTAPTVTVNITGTSTNSITASASAVDNQSGMPSSPTYTFYIKKTSEADSAYVEKQNNTNTTCSFTGLSQNTSYTVKVETKDNAENKGVGTKAGSTGTVTVATGNVTISAPTWNASTHTASVNITKESTVSSAFSIQYQIVQDTKNITEANWKTGTSIANLKLNDIVCARLWDGTNGGSYTNVTITESTVPTVTVNITGTSTNSITASASAVDNQSGMPASPTYTFFLKKTSEADSAYVEKHTGTETSFTFTSLAQTTGYTVKVETKDNAGNKGAGTKAGTTGTVTIAEGNVTIGNPTWDATAHTATVAITKGSSVPSGLQIQYQVNSTTGSWTTGTSKSGLKLNDTVYARLWDGTNGGAYTSLKITESTAPTVTVNITGTSTNSITASASAVDNQSGMPASPTYTFFIKKTSEADSAYVEKHTGTETSFTFTSLAQTTGYTVKVETKDNAGNTGAGTKAGTTGTVTIAEGNVTIGNPSWDATAHTATVAITKGSSVASGLQIQYQVNSTTGSWTTGTSKSGLKLNDTVYARLWDGTNGGAYTSLKITESTVPTVTVNITGTSTNSITASASAVDNQSGMPAKPTYTFYIKKTSEADSAYKQQYSGENTSYTFTSLAQTTGYTVKVETKDNAGNKGAGTKAGSTGTVTIAEGNVTIGNPTWDATAHTATVAITKGSSVASGLQIQYQVNSTSGAWTTGTSKSGLKLNDTVYARLWDGTNGGAYTSLKITESTVPNVTVSITGTSTNSITASATSKDDQSGMPAKPTYVFYIKKTNEADSAYVQKQNNTNTTCSFTGLAQNTSYTVKVETKDNAGNKGSGTKAGSTGTVTIAEGNVTIGNPTWDATAHTATVAITKGSSVPSGLQIQYQVNSTSGAWTTGTSKSGLKLNDTVYARLWDGTNGGAYTSLKITESTVPTVTVNITGTSTNSITASASAVDNQSGMPAKPTYTFYIKKTSEADSAYKQQYSGENSSYTFTSLAQTTGYTVKVETKDNAGNTGAGTKAGSTGTVTIAEGNVTIGNPTWDATAHTATVSITKGSSVASGLQIQYQVNSTTGSWTTGTSKSGLKLNDTVHARLWDGTNGGAYTSLKITESTVPNVTVSITGTSTNSITASATSKDDQSGMPAKPTYTFYIKKTSEADSAYKQQYSGENTSYTFTSLAQTTGYTVKVETKDNAGNKGAGTKAGSTGTVTIAEGNVTIGNPTWDATAHTASVSITKGSSVASGLQIQYQVNSTTGSWTTGTSKSGLKLNDTVYARLWDGTNGGAYTSLKITESTVPTVTVNITGTSTNSITASASAVDNQSGMPTSPTYTFFIKKTNEADSAYVQKQNNTNTTCSFTGLAQNTSYTVKVETKDNAGNKGAGTKAGSTGTVTIAEGNVTIGNPSWNATDHTASVTITKGSSVAGGLQIQYQVNSTTGSWTTGTSKSGLKLNDTVYARLWDGTNGGAYTSLKITENTAPTVNVGTMLYADPEFATGVNGTRTYNNSANGTVTNTRKTMANVPNSSGYVIEIKTTGTANPGHGGFYFGTATSANKEYVTRIVAKIPTGYNINWASNATGDGRTTEWLTSNAGTGNWKEYVVKVKCGSTGTFSTTNYFYLSGGSTATESAPVVWQVAYATVIDASNITTTTNSVTVNAMSADKQSGMPAKPTYTFYIKKTSEADSTYKQQYNGENSSYTFTNLSQTTGYTVKVETKDNAGNVGRVIKTLTTGTTVASEGNITFALSPDKWTSGNVTVTGTSKVSGYTIQVSKNTTFPSTATEVKSVTVSANQTVYARLVDSTNQANGYATVKVTKIDTTKPVVTGATPTTNSVAITATDEASGIIGYAVTTSTTAPTSFTSCTNTKSLSTTVSNLTQNKTYYVWVKDEAGNVSVSKSFTTGQVAASSGNITFALSPTGWTSGSVTVTGTSKVSGYKVQVSTSTTFPSSATEVKSVTVSANQTVYARLVDSTNQANGYATVGVTTIDKTVPTISTALSNTSKTTNSMVMSMGVTDAQSGLSKITWYYKLSTATNYTSVTDTYTAMNGSTAGTKTAVTKTHTFSSLAAGTYNVYAEAYDVAGNKTKSGTVNVELKTITVTASMSPTTWTGGDVTVTLTAANGGTIYYGTSETAMNTKYTAAFKQASNATIYYYVTDGTNKTAAGTLKITKIDKTKPVVTGATPTTNSVAITATDEASGIIGYAVTTSTTAPTSFTSCTNTKSLSTTVSNLTQNKTYYVWVKDEAGNVSVSKSFTTGQVVASSGNITFALSPTGWTSGSVTVTGTSKVSGYKIQVSTSTTFPSSATEVKSVTVSANQTVYARLVDSTNQANGYATVGVTTIDTTKPVVTGATPTKNSVAITATDVGSGIVGYAVTTTNTAPSSFTTCTSTTSLSTTVSSLAQNTTYYVWVKDAVGYVSASKNFTTLKQAITGITLNKTSVSIPKGSEETLTATITPTDAYNKNITWSSNNTEVASVSNGKITGLSLGTATITATAQDGSGKRASCDVTVTHPTLASVAKPGDYVNYSHGNKAFQISAAQAGRNQAQTFFTVSYYGKWVVLYNDDLHGLQIISDTPVGNLSFGEQNDEIRAITAYNNAINTLNYFCTNYVNSEYAINGRCVGSDPVSPSDKISNNMVLPFMSEGSYDSKMRVGDDNYIFDYETLKEMRTVTGTLMNSGDYYFASRVVDEGYGSFAFGIRNSKSAPTYVRRIYEHGHEGYSDQHGVRPVITLKPDVLCAGGNPGGFDLTVEGK